MFHFRKRSLVGLDIDTFAVRMVQLRGEDGGYVVTGACVNEIAPWGDDPQLRRIHTVHAIRQGLSECSFEGRLAVCGLRGSEVVVRGFEFPALPPEEIGSAVELEASQICPFSADESTFDYQVTSSDARKTRGFWVAANNGLIRSTRHLVHEAGLRCAMVDVDGLALLNCLVGESLPEKETGPAPDSPGQATGRPAVLDVGGACTTFAIMDQAGRPFVRDIGSGSDEILRRMAVEAQVPFEIARATLLNYGLERSIAADPESEPRDETVLWDSLEGACAELVEDIATTLRYYAAQSGSGPSTRDPVQGGAGARVERLLVCGGVLPDRGVHRIAASQVERRSSALEPRCGVRCDVEDECQFLLREAGPSMALAAGLAMRHI